MKLLFQLISSKHGNRSQVLELTREQLAEQLIYSLYQARGDVDKKLEIEADYVLVIMEKPDPDFSSPSSEYTFSMAPIMTVKQFVEYLYNDDQVIDMYLQWDKLSDEKLQEQYA